MRWAPGIPSPEAISSPVAHFADPMLNTVHVAGAEMASPIRRFEDASFAVARLAAPPPGAGDEIAALATRAAQLEVAVRRMESLRAAADGGRAQLPSQLTPGGLKGRPILKPLLFFSGQRVARHIAQTSSPPPRFPNLPTIYRSLP